MIHSGLPRSLAVVAADIVSTHHTLNLDICLLRRQVIWVSQIRIQKKEKSIESLQQRGEIKLTNGGMS